MKNIKSSGQIRPTMSCYSWYQVVNKLNSWISGVRTKLQDK